MDLSSLCLVPYSSSKRKRDPSSSNAEHHRCKRPKYDVFVNYSLKDTGNKFVSHLKEALKRNIFTITDHNPLPIGQDMSCAQLKAIEDSHIYLVVFSPNYSHSIESLDELVLIIDSLPKFKNRKIIPVFCNVDPSDVRNLKGCFEKAFRTHEVNIDQDRVCKWKQALKAAGQIIGIHIRNGDNEADILQSIIQDLKKIKIPLELFDAEHPAGIEPRAQSIISALRLGDRDFHKIVAVFGISGSGKTTIVQAVFDRIVAEFDYYCFIKNIHFYKNKGPCWEIELQREVLRGLTGNDPTHGNVGAPEIRRLIDSQKALLVLDDVEKVDDLKAVGLHCDSLSCGSGSRVIVTTRNKGSLGNLPYTCYDINLLDWVESFELFVGYAYGEDEPVDKMFVHEIVRHAGGLPLVLKVWGLHFKAHEREEWPNLFKILKRIPHEDIHEKLRISYDSLPDETKSFFLDIVCFFDGMRWKSKSYENIEDAYMEMNYTFHMYEHSMCRILHDEDEDELFFPEIKIKPLVDRGLVKIEYDRHDVNILRVVIHEVIREMGKEVVRQENKKEPGKRTRLVNERDVLHVLKNNSGTSSVKCISLENDYNSSEEQSIKNIIGAFKKMNNLRFIKLVGVENFLYSSSNDDVSLCFKQLKYLKWESFPWRSVNNLDMPNVVVLVLRYSKLEILWDGIKNLKKLRILDVYHSESLTMTGSFIGLENLEELHFNSCRNLKEVDSSSIICLKKLLILNISRCENIKSIPNLPPSIKIILARGCKNLVNLPSNMSDLLSLRILDLSHCWNLGSEGLMRVTRLKKLQHLNMVQSNVSQVSSEIGNFESLQKLYLWGNKFCSLPDSLSKLSQLVHLEISYCRELRSLPLLPSKLTSIYATDCSSLDIMPFDSMRKSNVFHSKLFEESFIAKPLWIDLTYTMVPEVFHYTGDRGQVLSFIAPKRKIYGAILYISSFISIGLRNRTKETSYEFENPQENDDNPDGIIICLLNETTLVVEAGDTVEVIGENNQSHGFRFIYEGDVVDSTTLAIQNTINVNVTHQNTSSVPSEMNETATSIAQNLKKLRILDISCSSSLTRTGSFSGLENLEELSFFECSNLKEMDRSIICLKKLHILNLSNCKNIESIPNLPPNIKLLLAGDCTNLVNLPSNMSELQSLKALGLNYCSNLGSESLTRVTGLRMLQHLNMIGSNVSQVSIEIGNLESLQKLYLCDNKFCSLPDSMSNLLQLVHLDISGCHELRSLPLLPSKLTLINTTDCPSLDVMPFDPMRKANVFRSKLFEESFFAKPLCISLNWKNVPEIFQYKGDRGQGLSFVAAERKIYGAIFYANGLKNFKCLELRNRTKETSYQFEIPNEYYLAREVINICSLNESTLVVDAGDTVEVIFQNDGSYGLSLIYEGDVVDSTLVIQNRCINVTDENTCPVPSEISEAATIAQLTNEFGFFSIPPTNQENPSPVYHVFFS